MTAVVVLLVLILTGVVVLIAVWIDAMRRDRQARAARLTRTWRVLQAANRINVAHFRARQMMQAEADRHQDEDLYSS